MFGQTELDTFKILSNSDMVDWSRRVPSLKKVDEWGGDEPPSVNSSPKREVEIPTSGTLLREDFAKDYLTPVTTKEIPYRRSISHSPLPKSRSPSPPHREVEFVQDSPPKLRTPPSPEVRSTPEYKPREIPRRVMPQPKKYTASEENDDYEIKAEKEGILHELHTFSRPPHNIKMTREWDVNIHTLDELQYELDRINSELNANGIVDMAKSGIKFGVSGLEMFLKQQGLDSVDGWYNNSCKDMSKFNRPLLRLYKKYWRNTNMSPMMELGYLLMGGLVWTVAENKMGFKKPSSAPQDTTNPQPQPKMRPPSSSSFAIPKWSEPAKASEPKSEPEPKPEPKPEPERKQEKTELSELEKQILARQEATEEKLGKMANDNAMMIQLLQSLATTRISTPKQSPRASPKEIRFPLGKRSVKKTPRVNLVKDGSDEAMSL